MDLCTKTIDLFSRTNPDEFVVGWYTTVSEKSSEKSSGKVGFASSLLHLTLAELVEHGNPIMVVVDTRFEKPKLDVKAYRAETVEVGSEKKKAFMWFNPVPIERVYAREVTYDLESAVTLMESLLTNFNEVINNEAAARELMKLFEELKSSKNIGGSPELFYAKVLAEATRKQLNLADQIHSSNFVANN